MYTLKYDVRKNRIYNKVNGILRKEEMQEYYLDCIKTIKESRENSTLLVDLSESDVQLRESFDIMKDIRVQASNKIRKSAVVVTSIILKMQLTRTLRETNNPFDEQYFTSIEEAENYLDVV